MTHRPAPELRRALWHLRHSGLTGLREHLRRRRATAWARPRQWASRRRDRTLLPDWPLPCSKLQKKNVFIKFFSFAYRLCVLQCFYFLLQ